MKIEITGWEAKNLRCADMIVDLRVKSKTPKVSFVLMHNGTGKTTILKLIRAALDGEATLWNKNEIDEFKPNIQTALNSESSKFQSTAGFFKLDLLVNDKQIWFKIDFNFEDKTIKYSTQSPMIGGIRNSYDPPPNMKLFLQKKFVSLYIFDGELAEDLFLSNKARAKEAIETLSQLDLFDQLSNDLVKYWDVIKGQAPTSGSSQSQKTKLNNKITYCKDLIEKLKKDLREKTKDIVKLTADHNDLDSKINEALKRNKNLESERNRITSRINIAKNNLIQASDSFIQTLRSPEVVFSGFKNHLIKFKNNLDLAQLPEKSSRQFFVDMSVKEKCICGRPIGPLEKKHIIDHADEYLSTEISNVINHIKGDISSLTEKANENKLNDERILLEKAINELNEADTEWFNFESKLKSLTDEDYELWINERAEKKLKIDALQDEINIIDAPHSTEQEDWPLENIKSIRTLEALKKSYTNEYANLSGLLMTKNKIDKLNEYLVNAKEMAKSEINMSLLNACNEKITQTMLQNPVKIESIDEKITLKGQGGLSEGQGLAVAYIFLTVALSKGAHEFPLLVDSPSGSLDEVHSPKIAKLLPQLTKQFITLIQPKEKADFVDAFEQITNDIGYHTIIRKSALSEKLIKKYLNFEIKANEDSFQADDKKFFHDFTLKE